ncbi:hypothetical protein EJB05_16465, partial [Eragrostis curvula]
MALAGTIKAPMAAILLLALVVAAAAAVSPSTDAGVLTGVAWTAKGGQKQESPLTGLTECVTTCGSQVTACFLQCYKPAVGGDPVAVPVCLFNCTNTAMVCATSCSSNIV